MTSLRLRSGAHAAMVLAPSPSSQTRGTTQGDIPGFLRRICGYATNTPAISSELHDAHMQLVRRNTPERCPHAIHISKLAES